MLFQITLVERQLRAKAAYDNLYLGYGMTARQFEAIWEKTTAEMETVGLGKSELEKHLHYLKAIGPKNCEKVVSQKEELPDGAGSFVFRTAKTWKEAHKILVELEATRSNMAAMAGHGD